MAQHFHRVAKRYEASITPQKLKKGPLEANPKCWG